MTEVGTGPGDSSLRGETVAAVVVTFKRPNMLRACLVALLAQTRPLDEIIVVDNGGDQETEEMLAKLGGITQLTMQENLGPAGGYAAGMNHAYRDGHRYMWLFNDDTVPAPAALQECLDARLLLNARPGVVAHDAVPTTSTEPELVPYFNFNGALVDRSVIDVVGLPRGDFFMCYEEDDFAARLRRANLPIINLPTGHVAHVAAGTIGGATPPWRGYYQTRNELASVLRNPSWRSAWIWLVRTLKFSAATALMGDRKIERLRFRVLGIWHALRGISGRTVEPTETGGE
jgi:GT2 family glycosyltransferase